MSDPAITGNSDGLQIGSLQISTPQPRTSESPIQRLHPELLNEIFRLCIGRYIYDYPSGGGRRLPRPSVKEPPLILCRICRRWRQLVLANPLLWAQIELYGVCRSSHLVALDEWLIRSQQSPLHLSVTCHRYEGTRAEFEDQVSRVIAKLTPHSWRWKHVFFELPTACTEPIVRRLGEGSDSLEILKICDRGSSGGKESIAVNLSGHRVLSKLQMDARIHFIPNHSPMNNIRILHMSFLTIDEYLHCLMSVLPHLTLNSFSTATFTSSPCFINPYASFPQ
ncbi:hypothetical protein BD410DRAFT_478697 [Rickenella mellea]|uniref:F-box domain-containing protein n=1 Tax=Rickenella mellea TaxID=50990 RepID=A0A4Y7QJ92_9AGAM|nr:hypothetical protein BD410DRAFT_478697 [Rickenella mellea]